MLLAIVIDKSANSRSLYRNLQEDLITETTTTEVVPDPATLPDTTTLPSNDDITTITENLDLNLPTNVPSNTTEDLVPAESTTAGTETESLENIDDITGINTESETLPVTTSETSTEFEDVPEDVITPTDDLETVVPQE